MLLQVLKILKLAIVGYKNYLTINSINVSIDNGFNISVQVYKSILDDFNISIFWGSMESIEKFEIIFCCQRGHRAKFWNSHNRILNLNNILTI